MRFAKSDNAGGASGSRLPGLDLHPSQRLGLGDFRRVDGKAAGELAGGLGSTLAGEDGKETVESFAGEHRGGLTPFAAFDSAGNWGSGAGSPEASQRTKRQYRPHGRSFHPGRFESSPRIQSFRTSFRMLPKTRIPNPIKIVSAFLKNGLISILVRILRLGKQKGTSRDLRPLLILPQR